MKLAIIALTPMAWLAGAQTTEPYPQPCGVRVGSRPAVVDVSPVEVNGQTELFLGRNAPGIPLGPVLPSDVTVCPVSDGRLVVFAYSHNGPGVMIVDPRKGAVLDRFSVHDPQMSPDQRWIAYKKFYFPGSEQPPTDEYLIYDLMKSPSQNRPSGDVTNDTDVGAVIFPPGQRNLPGDNYGAPEQQQHKGASRFYWAPDSRAILFLDRTKSPSDVAVHSDLFSVNKLILVTLDQNDVPSAFEHRMTVADLCGNDTPEIDRDAWTVDRAEVGPDQGGSRSILVDLHLQNPRCPPHLLQLYTADFQPVAPEVHVRKVPDHGMKKEGFPPVPPKKK